MTILLSLITRGRQRHDICLRFLSDDNFSIMKLQVHRLIALTVGGLGVLRGGAVGASKMFNCLLLKWKKTDYFPRMVDGKFISLMAVRLIRKFYTVKTCFFSITSDFIRISVKRIFFISFCLRKPILSLSVSGLVWVCCRLSSFT